MTAIEQINAETSHKKLDQQRIFLEDLLYRINLRKANILREAWLERHPTILPGDKLRIFTRSDIYPKLKSPKFDPENPSFDFIYQDISLLSDDDNLYLDVIKLNADGKPGKATDLIRVVEIDHRPETSGELKFCTILKL